MHREQKAVIPHICPSSDAACNAQTSRATTTDALTYVTDLATTNKVALERIVAGSPFLHAMLLFIVSVFVLFLIRMGLWMKSKLF